MVSVTLAASDEVKLPPQCVCCLEPCGAEDVVQLSVPVPGSASGEAKDFAIPACAFCSAHWERLSRYEKRVAWLGKMSLFAFIAVALAMSKRFQQIDWNQVTLAQGATYATLTGLVLGLAGALLYFLFLLPVRLRKIERPGHLDRHATPAAISISPASNDLVFSFGNARYATIFREENASLADRAPRTHSTHS